jgi:hypothetical protein
MADVSKSPWRMPPAPDPDPPPSSIGHTLGVIALATGVVVLGLYVFDLHSHTCEACGERWRHLGVFNHGDPVSHTCGKCGTVQWWKDGIPHVFRSVLRTPPPKIVPDTLAARLQELRETPRLTLPAWPFKESR